MNALLLIAHGSRREASNEEVRQLVELVQSRAGELFDIFVPAFLELAEPSIADGVDRCIECGAQHVTVLPYFLSAGRHVVQDIPAAVNTARARHPDVDIRVLPHIGAADLMVGMVLESTGARRQATADTT